MREDAREDVAVRFSYIRYFRLLRLFRMAKRDVCSQWVRAPGGIEASRRRFHRVMLARFAGNKVMAKNARPKRRVIWKTAGHAIANCSAAACRQGRSVHDAEAEPPQAIVRPYTVAGAQV